MKYKNREKEFIKPGVNFLNLNMTLILAQMNLRNVRWNIKKMEHNIKDNGVSKPK